ncbi:multicopper oxidase family protein [Streptomyces sp. AS02]|uniref:multicopper oxidase family protein n=1 Tax=Streptomyces sp. AS02 TaxID=2938946 RepID=UPI0020221667|nr:multicopper oxidase domain-containing protein [Streptomyces sp. AS02]MCL8017265.1 multicopper oxidase domain-containing protein [Streptomyces sp. AS02]
MLIGTSLSADAAEEAATTEETTAADGGTLPIPDLLSGEEADGVLVYDLTMQTGTHELLSGVTSETAGYNGSFLGPTLRMTKGDQVQINVTNSLGEVTTTHWHGLHIPAEVDGGPQSTVEVGDTWSPTWEVLQEAMTCWYHPHALGTTAEQVTKGLAGMIIIDDDSEASAALPVEYGVDDVPIIMQCLAVGSDGGIKHDVTGYLESDLSFPLLVNGAGVAEGALAFTAEKTRTRLRFLNASPADFLTISRKDGTALTQVATEGGYLTEALETDSIQLSPGNRAEIVLDLEDAVTLQAVIENHFVQGGSGTHDFLTITPSGSDSPDDLPSTLNTIERLDTTDATEREIRLTGSGLTLGINDVSGTTMEAMEENMIMAELDATEVWTIKNELTNAHPFHIHDVPHQIVSYNGEDPTGVQLGWHDTTIVLGGGEVKVALKFTDFADSEYMYMMHCHILMHEDLGMMAGLMVTDSTTEDATEESTSEATGESTSEAAAESTSEATEEATHEGTHS